ncbi:MAG: hypothetical protein V4471_01110 [Pseudomonadota bacterium]
MKKIICVFLDSLLVKPYNLSGVNQTRIAELKDYLDSADEVFIYTTDYPKEYKQFFSRLEEIIELITKNLREIITINSSAQLAKFDKDILTKHNNYLKNKAEAGAIVIVVGEFGKLDSTRKIFNFTLVNWPYGSKKTLAQLCSEQIQLDSERSAASGNITPNFLQPKQIEKRDVISCDCQSLQAQMLQLEESQLRLITSIGTFEKEMIQSERTQIHLLEDSAKNFPLHAVETAATLGLLAWHVVPYIYEKICKIINYYSDKPKNDEPKSDKSKRVKLKRVKPKRVKPKAVANATATKPKIVNLDRQTTDSFPYSYDVESLAANHDKNIGLKNFAKNKDHNVNGLRRSGTFFNKKDNSDIHMPLFSSDECSKSSETNYCKLELA